MLKKLLILFALTLTACGPTVRPNGPAIRGTLGPLPTQMDASPNNILATQTETATPVPATEPTADIFSALEMPVCSGVTPQDQEGPYYTPNTPEKNSLLEESMQGDKLILIGYVLNAECQPIANAWLDFWQADANGEYDNTGYTLRGHQFTDEEGRYYLETIIPGLYSSRPIGHIHVKVQAPNAEILTTQLYFPEQPIEGLTVQLTETEGQYQAIYNFILP